MIQIHNSFANPWESTDLLETLFSYKSSERLLKSNPIRVKKMTFFQISSSTEKSVKCERQKTKQTFKLKQTFGKTLLLLMIWAMDDFNYYTLEAKQLYTFSLMTVSDKHNWSPVSVFYLIFKFHTNDETLPRHHQKLFGRNSKSEQLMSMLYISNVDNRVVKQLLEKYLINDYKTYFTANKIENNWYSERN